MSRLILLGLFSVVMASTGQAGIIHYHVRGQFLSTAANDPPITAPDGIVEYSFQIDDSAGSPFPGSSNRVDFPSTNLSYSLNGVETMHTVIAVLQNGATESNLGLIGVNGYQVILNLQNATLFTGPNTSPTALTGVIDFRDGFVDNANPASQFGGRLTITAVPEPTSVAMWSVLALGMAARRRKKAS